MDRAGVEARMEGYRRAWVAVAVEYDGVIVLRVDGDRCRELREWFFRRETR